jgi:hypothetical protein
MYMENLTMNNIDKARAIVKYAKSLGFTNARVAVWDHAGDGEGNECETPVEHMLEYDPLPPIKGEHDIGIYLNKSVYSAVVNGPGDDDENPVGETFDTRAERDKWFDKQTSRAAHAADSLPATSPSMETLVDAAKTIKRMPTAPHTVEDGWGGTGPKPTSEQQEGTQ